MKPYTTGLRVHGPSNVPGIPGQCGDYALLDADGKIVGEAYRQVGPAEVRPAEANALLWAAAPELLESLAAVRAHLHYLDGASITLANEARALPRTLNYADLIKTVDAALAKAKGGQS